MASALGNSYKHSQAKALCLVPMRARSAKIQYLVTASLSQLTDKDMEDMATSSRAYRHPSNGYRQSEFTRLVAVIL